MKRYFAFFISLTVPILLFSASLTASAAETTTSVSDAVKGILSDSGISDAVDNVLGGLEDSGGISDVVGGLSDRISGRLDDYSSILDGLLNGSGGTQGTTAPQVTKSFGDFVLPDSNRNNQQNATTSAATTAQAQPETTTVPAAAPTTAAAKPAEPVTSAGTVKDNDNRGAGIWIFIAIAAAIIMIAVVTLIAVTGHTEFNSRVYDRSTIKSVKKHSSSEVEFDDDEDEPMDNIMYTGSIKNSKTGSRG